MTKNKQRGKRSNTRAKTKTKRPAAASKGKVKVKTKRPTVARKVNVKAIVITAIIAAILIALFIVVAVGSKWFTVWNFKEWFSVSPTGINIIPGDIIVG